MGVLEYCGDSMGEAEAAVEDGCVGAGEGGSEDELRGGNNVNRCCFRKVLQVTTEGRDRHVACARAWYHASSRAVYVRTKMIRRVCG